MPRVAQNFTLLFGQYRRLWIGLWVVKLLFALAATLPVLVMIQAKLDHSKFAELLLGEWSGDVIMELIYTNDNLFSASFFFLLAIVALGFLAKQFLNGGIYDSLLRGLRPESERFYTRSASMFLQHLVISVWMLLVYLLLFLCALLVGELISSIARKLIPELDLTRFVIRLSATYLVMFLGAIFSDLVRLHRTAAVNSGRFTGGLVGIGQSFKSAYFVLAGRGWTLLTTYLTYFLPFLILWLSIEGLALLITGGLSNLLGAVIEFLLFQLCALARVGQSLTGTLALTRFIALPEPEPQPEDASDRAIVLP